MNEFVWIRKIDLSPRDIKHKIARMLVRGEAKKIYRKDKNKLYMDYVTPDGRVLMSVLFDGKRIKRVK